MERLFEAARARSNQGASDGVQTDGEVAIEALTMGLIPHTGMVGAVVQEPNWRDGSDREKIDEDPTAKGDVWNDDDGSSRIHRRDRGRRADYGARDSGRRGEGLTHEEMRRAPSDKALELWVSVDPDLNREILSTVCVLSKCSDHIGAEGCHVQLARLSSGSRFQAEKVRCWQRICVLLQGGKEIGSKGRHAPLCTITIQG